MLDPHAELLRINARIKEILLRHMPDTGTYDSPVPGLVTRRLETCHTTTCLGKPSASIIVQGEKIAMLGDREIHYGEGQCLVTGIDMPNAFRVLKACREHPFLAMSLELDRSLTGQMVKDMADAARPRPARTAVSAWGRAALNFWTPSCGWPGSWTHRKGSPSLRRWSSARSTTCCSSARREPVCASSTPTAPRPTASPGPRTGSARTTAPPCW